jgi:hypothetical protein
MTKNLNYTYINIIAKTSYFEFGLVFGRLISNYQYKQH